MATEQVSDISVMSLVEDVIQQHGPRLRDFDFASRKAEEAALRRNEAAGWLRKTVGVVGGKDLPAEPSEEEFRLGLRSGIILCNVLNKIQPGAVPMVVEGPSDSVLIPDGAALSVFQYFENVRNFLVAVEEMGLPSFEASDMEKGGKSSRIVNCVLALKSYHDWKQSGGIGTWKYGGSTKPQTSGTAKPFRRKNSDAFMNCFSRASSLGSLSGGESCLGDEIINELNETGSSGSLSTLIRSFLSNNKQEEIPYIVESLLNKVMAEFECRLSGQNEQGKAAEKDVSASILQSSLPGPEPSLPSPKPSLPSPEPSLPSPEPSLRGAEPSSPGAELSPSKTTSSDTKIEEEAMSPVKMEEFTNQTDNTSEDESAFEKGLLLKQAKLLEEAHLLKEAQLLKQATVVERQKRDVQELKKILQNMKEGMQFLKTKHQEEFNNLGMHLHGLAHAAAGYKRVLEENRKLYNQVQDLKGNIRVYCRVRPFLPGQPNGSSSVEHIEEGNITVYTPSKYCKEGRKTFSFNKCFGPWATQEEVFSDTRPLIRSVLDGYNVCIFAYGQTGSGKTYTMTGPKELTEEGLGVNYRALGDLFLISEQRKEVTSYDILVQMLEIYNEQVRDLLATDGANKKLEIRNSSQNGINVPDASLIRVSNTSDVINLMNIGHKNRAVTATAMNDRSSRSHSCLTVHVQGRDLTSGNIVRGSMHLVDLAGSERVDKSEVTGLGLKEAQHINKSLAALGDVVASLASKNSHVPYRNSKLTQLLQDSLGGQAKTLMFVHISPEPDAVIETLSTLKFAERVATVELGAARVNKDSSEVKELKEQIANLKAALTKKEGETDYSQHSRSSTPERQSTKSSVSSRNSNTEGRKKSSSIQRRRSLDPQDLTMSSPPWPSSISSPAPSAKEDDRESASGDWDDKIMVNGHDSVSRDEIPHGQWEADYKTHVRDPLKIYPEQPHNKSIMNKKDGQEFDSQRTRLEMASTDESDELDVGTSDSSEPDLLFQSNLPRMSGAPNVLASKTKKTSTRAVKGTETRSSIPSLIPSASRKPNGVSAGINKPGRQLVSADGKRKTGHGK